MPRELTVKCPITGQRHKTHETDGAPQLLAEEDGIELPAGWGDLTIRRVLPNPAYNEAVRARAQKTEQLLAQIAAAQEQMGASDADVESASAEVPGEVDRQIPLPAELVSVEWTFSAISPDGIDAVAFELEKLGIVLIPLAIAEEEPVSVEDDAASDA